MTVTKKIDFTQETPYDKKLFFKRVTIINITYGKYPAVFDVVLEYENVNVYGKLHINENCIPEFKFDLCDYVNEITDRSKLSWEIFMVYVIKAVSLFYGVKSYSLSKKKIIGINLKWLRRSHRYSLKKGAQILNIDEGTLKRIENNTSSRKDIINLDSNLIKKVYGTYPLPITTKFLINTKFKPVKQHGG